MNDLKYAIRAFIEARDWEQFHSPKNLAMALSVEVAVTCSPKADPVTMRVQPAPWGQKEDLR